MRKLSLLMGLAVLAAGCVSLGHGTQNAVIRAKNKVAPALVHIRPIKEVFRRGKRREVQIVGSGFIISREGYVITNEHVAGKSKYVLCVLWDKDEVEGEVVGVDPFTDLAVLKLVTDRKDLPFVKLGDSSKLEAGQTVLALGSPHGLERSVSSGIVSVTNRNLESSNPGATRAPYNNWIQTDAAINPGNSGGPLVNLKGEVIGINTRKLSSADNVGFAIPINIAKEVINEIIETGKVVRSTIGVGFQEMRRKTKDPAQKGVVISDVDPLSPAFSARLRPGDILLSVNGVETNARFTEELPAVRKLIADAPIGEELELSIMRNGQIETIAVRTTEKSQLQGEEVEFEEWGCTISELTGSDIRRAQLSSKEGVRVSGAQVGGLMADAKIARGDIILKVDDEKVLNLEGFRATYEKLVETRKRLVLLTVKRGALTMYKLIKQEPASDEEEKS